MKDNSIIMIVVTLGVAAKAAQWPSKQSFTTGPKPVARRHPEAGNLQI